jgi:Fe-S cluster assembly iron-binding protein IscA
MTLEVTPEAAEVLRRSLELGGVEASTGGVRLRMARGLGGGASVQIELANAPLDGEEVVEADGVRLFVDPSAVEGIEDPVVALAQPHDRIVLRPRSVP